MKSFIGMLAFNTENSQCDVDREQIGINFTSPGKYIIEEVYYSNEKMNMISCPGCFYSFYKFEKDNGVLDNNDNV